MSLWFLSALIAAFLIASLSAIKDFKRARRYAHEKRDDTIPQERYDICRNMTDETVRCPVERFPVGASFFENFQQGDQDTIKEAMALVQQNDLTYLCDQVTGYLNCLEEINGQALQECQDVYDNNFWFFLPVILLYYPAKFTAATVAKGCALYYDDLNEHFSCLTDLDLVLRSRDNCSQYVLTDEEFANCVHEELDKTESCKTGAKELYAKLSDIYYTELNATINEQNDEAKAEAERSTTPLTTE